MTKVPFKHQVEGTEYLKKNKGGFLWMKPRTGKTKTACDWILQSNYSKILIVTKTTIMDVWEAELIDQYVPENQINVIRGSKDKREIALAKDVPINICNYEMLKSYKVFSAWDWECIIFDESTKIANHTSQVTQYCVRGVNKLRQQGYPPAVACLSGNPAPETPMQYASQALIAHGVYFDEVSLDRYLAKHWKKNIISHKWEMNNPLHIGGIKAWIKVNCFVRTMEELGLGSEIFYSKRFFEMNKTQKQAIGWSMGKRAKLNEIGEKVGDKVFVNYMNQIGAGLCPETGTMINLSKIMFVARYFEEHREPLVVTSFFKKPLAAAAEIFQEMGIRVCLVTGDTKPKFVDARIRDFQEGRIDIFLGQQNKIMMGVDLSRSSLMFNLSNALSGEVRDQLTKRCTNVNKKEPVEIVDLCFTDSMDSPIVSMLNNKGALSSSFLVGEMKTMAAQNT